jgi:cis-3-alkyl-4-acyloxetan-2-one decarboxylase
VVAIGPRLYPFTGKYHTHPDGLRQHYLDEGSGEPVVMVHGNPTWSFYYRHLVLALRDRWRCVVPDHVGCGLSDKPGADRYDFSLRRRVDDLERLLDAAGVNQDVTLVVHDWGGMIGLAWAVRHPERVKRLVVLNTAAFHLPPSKPLPWALRLGRNTRLGAWLILRLNAFCEAAARVCVKRHPLPAAVRRAYLAPYDTPAHRLAVLRFVQTIPLRQSDPGYDIVSETEKRLDLFRDRPVLVVWGLRDFVFDRHFLAEWGRRFPHAEIHRFADAGHYILEDARDEVIGLMRRFLGDHPIA